MENSILILKNYSNISRSIVIVKKANVIALSKSGLIILVFSLILILINIYKTEKTLIWMHLYNI